MNTQNDPTNPTPETAPLSASPDTLQTSNQDPPDAGAAAHATAAPSLGCSAATLGHGTSCEVVTLHPEGKAAANGATKATSTERVGNEQNSTRDEGPAQAKPSGEAKANKSNPEKTAQIPETLPDLGDDLEIVAQLSIRGSAGVILDIKPVLRLPLANHPSMLPESVQQLNLFLDQFLSKPAKIKFNEYVHEQMEKKGLASKPASAAPGVEEPEKFFDFPAESEEYPEFPASPPPKSSLEK